MKPINSLKNYFSSCYEELQKVTWPTKNEAVKMTVIVLVFCILFGVFLGVFDFLFSELHKLVIS
jgi:preprotein translocase subunit SecE